MTELNILEMFKFAFSAIITSKAIVLLAFELIVFVVIAITLITVSIIFIHKMNDKAVDNCINNGNSASFCNANIRG